MDARKILGVDANATLEEIQRAYRQKVRKHHPDMGGDAWAFQQVQEAFEELTNPTPPQMTTQKHRPPKPPQNKRPQQPQDNRPDFQTTPPSSNTQYRRSNPTNSSKNKTKRSPNAKPNAQNSNPDTKFENRKWWQMFVGELPLQATTFIFIILNCCDIFFTYKLMNLGAIEANPIANYFLKMWGFNGMIAFKLTIVAFVCVIAQVIALKRVKTARGLLIAGSFLVGCVVLYSYWLFRTHF